MLAARRASGVETAEVLSCVILNTKLSRRDGDMLVIRNWTLWPGTVGSPA